MQILDKGTKIDLLSFNEKKRLTYRNEVNAKNLVFHKGETTLESGEKISDYLILPGSDHGPGEGQYVIRVSFNDRNLYFSIWMLIQSYSLFDNSLRFYIDPYEEEE